jgi:hypothetical protein
VEGKSLISLVYTLVIKRGFFGRTYVPKSLRI